MDLSAVVSELKDPICETWDAIGFDAEELCDGDNECAVEMCIDANRLSVYASQKADDLVHTAVKEFGYNVLLSALSKHIILV